MQQASCFFVACGVGYGFIFCFGKQQQAVLQAMASLQPQAWSMQGYHFSVVYDVEISMRPSVKPREVNKTAKASMGMRMYFRRGERIGSFRFKKEFV